MITSNQSLSIKKALKQTIEVPLHEFTSGLDIEFVL